MSHRQLVTLPNSSSTITCSSRVRPAPPHSSGHVDPVDAGVHRGAGQLVDGLLGQRAAGLLGLVLVVHQQLGVRGGARLRAPAERGCMRSPSMSPSVCVTIRASRAVAPDGVTSSGLISSSAISGWAAAYSLRRATVRAAAAMSTPDAAAVLAEQRRSAQPHQHAGRLGLVDRRERDLDVAQHLGGGTAHADQDGRAEARIPPGADDQLDTAAQVGHLLDRERRRVELGDQPFVRLEERRTGLQARPRRRLRRICAAGPSAFRTKGGAELVGGRRSSSAVRTSRAATNWMPLAGERVPATRCSR